MELGPRKFFKFFSLNFVFKVNEVHDETLGDIAVFNTSENGFNDEFLENYVSTDRVNKHTIMFITANADDEHVSEQGNESYVEILSKTPSTIDDESDIIETHYRKVHAGDTMIWARGHLYCVSTKSVVNAEFNEESRLFTFTYNNGTTESIDLSSQDYVGLFPITINEENKTISLEDIYYDENRNLVIGTNSNNSTSNIVNRKFIHVEGEGNKAIVSYQHVEGKYALVNENYIFVIGGGESGAPLNIFTITFDGVAHLKNDVTAGGTPENPDYKLSDIHSVLDVDWTYLGEKYADYNGRDFSDEDFDALETT